MKTLKIIFSKFYYPVRQNKLFSNYLKSNEFVDEIINSIPTLITTIKNYELSGNKIKQDNIYFRQRSIKYKESKNSDNQFEIKKTLIYKLFLEQEIKKKKENFQETISYRDVEFLKTFLTKAGKIRSRRMTKLKRINHSFITKLIKQSRSKKLIPLKFFIIS